MPPPSARLCRHLVQRYAATDCFQMRYPKYHPRRRRVGLFCAVYSYLPPVTPVDFAEFQGTRLTAIGILGDAICATCWSASPIIPTTASTTFCPGMSLHFEPI